VGDPKPATDVTDYRATFTGNVYSNKTGATAWWFEYGKTTAYGTSTPHRSVQISDQNPHAVTEPISGLAASTTYHYRLCAQDTEPGTGPGCRGDTTFTTLSPEDSVLGYGAVSYNAQPLGSLYVDAHSGPQGQSPHGSATGTTKYGYPFGGPVRCLRVQGARAVIGTADFVFFIEDQGAAGGTYDEAATGSDANVCPVFPSTPAASRLGGVVVHDAP
jgi:hypothetical protein